MSARILIVEDEEPLTMLLRYNLEAEGYEVETAARGDEADTRLKESTPDLVVLDWMLPGLSGIELCRRLRARPETRQLPIIMLTARGEESEKVRGLATGADDYIVKPFSVPELLARVRALLRRANPERVASVLTIGDIELDREKKRVSRSGRAVDLGPTEYRLLEFLMEQPGPGVLARATARRRLGQRHLYRRAHRRRACRPPAQGDQSRPRWPTRSAPCAAPATRSTTASARADADGLAQHTARIQSRNGRLSRRRSLERLIGDARVIRAIGRSFAVSPPQKKNSALPGSPIGQRQVFSVSCSRVLRCSSGISISSGSGSTS